MELAITTAAFFCMAVFIIALAVAAVLKAYEMEKERKHNINNQNNNRPMNENKTYIANAFSLQMLTEESGLVAYRELSEEEFRAKTADAVSAVGHPDTAAVLRVPCQRINVKLNYGDRLYVAQLIGGRLPEGATTLPEGFSFKYYEIKV